MINDVSDLSAAATDPPSAPVPQVPWQPPAPLAPSEYPPGSYMAWPWTYDLDVIALQIGRLFLVGRFKGGTIDEAAAHMAECVRRMDAKNAHILEVIAQHQKATE